MTIPWLGSWDAAVGPWITLCRKRTARGLWLPLCRVYRTKNIDPPLRDFPHYHTVSHWWVNSVGPWHSLWIIYWEIMGRRIWDWRIQRLDKKVADRWGELK